MKQYASASPTRPPHPDLVPGRPGAAPSDGRFACRDPPQRRQRGRRLAAWRQLGEQFPGGLGHGADRLLERGFGARRQGLDSAYLAHVLARGGLDFLARGGRLEAPERGDIAAHGFDATLARRGRTGLARPVPAGRRPTAVAGHDALTWDVCQNTWAGSRTLYVSRRPNPMPPKDDHAASTVEIRARSLGEAARGTAPPIPFGGWQAPAQVRARGGARAGCYPDHVLRVHQHPAHHRPDLWWGRLARWRGGQLRRQPLGMGA